MERMKLNMFGEERSVQSRLIDCFMSPEAMVEEGMS